MIKLTHSLKESIFHFEQKNLSATSADVLQYGPLDRNELRTDVPLLFQGLQNKLKRSITKMPSRCGSKCSYNLHVIKLSLLEQHSDVYVTFNI